MFSTIIYADILKKSDDLFKKSKSDIIQNKNTIKNNYKNQNSTVNNNILSNELITAQKNVIKLNVWLGACKYLPDMLIIAKSFMEKHKNIEYHFYILNTDEKFNIETVKEQIKDITFELNFDKNPKELPYFVFTDGTKEYSISGLIDLEEAYKEFTNSTTSINKGIQGRHCIAIQNYTQEQIEKPHIPDTKSIIEKITKQLIIKLPHSNKQEKYIKTEGAEYLPFKKFYVISSKDLSLINSNEVGCCIDCIKTNERIQSCSKELLEKLNVTSVPTVIYFQK